MSANVDWQEIHRLIEQLYADKVRELLAHALEEARFRQESCFRMWLPVGGSWQVSIKCLAGARASRPAASSSIR
jgi:hypothetical protein